MPDFPALRAAFIRAADSIGTAIGHEIGRVLKMRRLPMLACPRCRGFASTRWISRQRLVPHCTSCRFSLGWFPTRAEASLAWNRRVRPTLIGARSCARRAAR